MITFNQIWLVQLAGLVLLIGLVASIPQPQGDVVQKTEPPNQASARANFKLPRMFDFEHFKSAFRKRYSSAVEEMVRLKLFLARAYRAFMTAVKYKYRRAKYYLAVSSRSDWTQKEIEATYNKLGGFEGPDAAAGGSASQAVNKELEKSALKTEAPAKPELLVDPEAIEVELERVRQQHSKLGYKQLKDQLESHVPGQLEGVRENFELPRVFERSLNPSSEQQLYSTTVMTNNSSHEPLDVANHGNLRDAVKRDPDFRPVGVLISNAIDNRDYSHLPVKGNYQIKTHAPEKLSQQAASPSSVDPGVGWTWQRTPAQPDAVWVDHRESGCVNPVQSQGQCGACYAFASIAFFEWAYCKETGSLVKFSEQYVISCGKQRLANIGGCKGGSVTTMGLFALNFGLELADRWPYEARNGHCSYAPDTPIAEMGAIRVAKDTMTFVPLSEMERYLVHVPMLVNVVAGPDFYFYGGGVYDGKRHKTSELHSMLLIGHGRQDDEEYWLMRNSFSEDFGEAGYFKLNKNSDYIEPAYGLIYALRLPDDQMVGEPIVISD